MNRTGLYVLLLITWGGHLLDFYMGYRGRESDLGWYALVTAAVAIGFAWVLVRMWISVQGLESEKRASEKRQNDLEDLAKNLEQRVHAKAAALRTAEARFKTTFDEAAIGIAHVSLDGSWSLVNRRLCQIVGYTEEELKHKKFGDITHPDDLDRDWELARALLNGEIASYEMEKRYIRKDGSLIWVKLSAALSRREDGAPDFFISCIDDITERKQLRDEKERLYELPNHLLCVLDNGGIYKDVNQGFTNVLGYNRDELVGRSMWEFVHPDDITRTVDTERHGPALVIHAFENRYRSKSGTYRWLRWTGTIVDGINYAAAIDVTELKELEQSLKDSEARFKTVANSIPQMAWETDATGAIAWYNERWFEYSGTTLAQSQGWGWKDIQHPDHLERVLEKWHRHLQSGEAWEDTFPLRGRDGGYRWFLSRAVPVRDEDGAILHWFGTNTDITDQLRIERELIESKNMAERANLAKSQFLANMSHEIRTPIGVIMGFTELLKNPKLGSSDRSHFSSIIERNSNQLLRLIDDVLDLSKVEAGKVSIDRSEISLSEFFKDFEFAMGLKARSKKIELQLQYAADLPSEITADPIRLRQILNNIVGNAIKFTDRGMVVLDIRFEAPNLIMVVRDTGIGIARDHVANLFQPFGQADPSSTRRFGGTGLGLILAKRLAQAMGGDLTLDWTEESRGSCFTIRIEATAVIFGEDRTPDSKLSQSSISMVKNEDRMALVLQGSRVLLIEDSPDNRILVQHFLRNTGADLSVALDGFEGVAMALRDKPDLVLMDIQMPVMDGHQATQKLRKAGFRQPIIALTAHAMGEERELCFRSGFNDFLTKPLGRDTLIEVLAKYRKCAGINGIDERLV